jgi:hypothetical protein
MPKTRNPPEASPLVKPQRVSITDSFAAIPGSLRKARSGRRDYNHNMHQGVLNIRQNFNDSNRALIKYAAAR